MSTSTSLARLQQLLPQLFQPSLPEGKAYLRFQLTADIAAAISMERVQASLLVPGDRITPLPNLPEAVIGIINTRDRFFCVFDLAQLFMLPSTLISARQYHTIVLRVNVDNLPVSFGSNNNSALLDAEELFVGIAVDRIQGIVRLTADKLRSPELDSLDPLLPYISRAAILQERGYANEDDQQILLLNIDSISEAICKLNY
jgi:positive phototaxis protein PixI